MHTLFTRVHLVLQLLHDGFVVIRQEINHGMGAVLKSFLGHMERRLWGVFHLEQEDREGERHLQAGWVNRIPFRAVQVKDLLVEVSGLMDLVFLPVFRDRGGSRILQRWQEYTHPLLK